MEVLAHLNFRKGEDVNEEETAEDEKNKIRKGKGHASDYHLRRWPRDGQLGEMSARWW